MPTVGEQLRNAREAMKLQVQDVARETNLRTDHIAALEAGDYTRFTAAVYIRGSVRSYAALLKIEPAPLLAALDEELNRNERFQEPSAGGGRRKGILDAVMLQLSQLDFRTAALVLVGIGILVVMIVGTVRWLQGNEPESIPEQRLPMYQPTNWSAGETLPVPGSGQ